MAENPPMEKDLTATEIEQKYAEIGSMPGGFFKDTTGPSMTLVRAASKLGDKDRAEQLRIEAGASHLTHRGNTFPNYFQPAIVNADGSTSRYV